MRVLGIDYGQKTIGVAVSDETAMFARGVAAVPRNSWETEIPALIGRYQAALVVIGFPRGMDNRENEQTRRVLDFMGRLKKITACPVVRWDERLTTRQAERYLLEADLSRRGRKRVIDRLAAQILLQDYLDYTRREEFLPEKEMEEF